MVRVTGGLWDRGTIISLSTGVTPRSLVLWTGCRPVVMTLRWLAFLPNVVCLTPTPRPEKQGALSRSGCPWAPETDSKIVWVKYKVFRRNRVPGKLKDSPRIVYRAQADNRIQDHCH